MSESNYIYIPPPIFDRGDPLIWRGSELSYNTPKIFIVLGCFYGLSDRTWYYEVHAGESERKFMAAQFELKLWEDERETKKP